MQFKSLTQILLSAYLVRLFVTGASIGDAISILSLAGLYGFWMYTEFKREPEVNKDFKERILLLEEKMQRAETKLGAQTLANQLNRR